jgi:hypothetical protein
MASKKSVKQKHVVAGPDFWGNQVHCTADHWTGHIIDPLDGHPELTGREHEVAKVIRDPEIIRPSTKTGKAFAFERVTSADTIRVIVYYEDASCIKAGRTFGTVGTAYPVDAAYYSSQVGAPIYQKPAPNQTSQSQTKKEGEA